MARMVLQALREMLTTDWDQLQAEMGYASWTEELEKEHYTTLQTIINTRDDLALFMWSDNIFNHYFQLWVAYHKPTTHEEWMQNKEVTG